jgi:transcription-repair coupling factor (superfamily II helicase)
VAATVDHARRLLDQGTPWSGLGGDSLAYVLATVATTGRWLVAVDGEDRAERVARALRFFHADPDRVLSFPADDQRPYDGFSPAPAVVHARLRALERVDRGGDVIVVASARALSQRVPDRATRARGTLTLEVGQRIDRDEVVRQLTDAGYLHTARADEVGHVAARGDLVDVWPAAKAAPVRLEWFDDELERIVRLDPSTLTPDKAGKKVTVLPAAEERLDAAARQRALVELARLMQRQGDGSANMRRRAFVDALEAGARTSALQDWLPVLVPTVAPLEALAGLRLVVVAPDDVAAMARDFAHDCRRRFEALDPEDRPLVPPDDRFVPVEQVLAGLAAGHGAHDLATDRTVDLQCRGTDELAVRGTELAPVVERLQQWAHDDARIALVVEDEARRDRLLEMLVPHGLRPELARSPLQLPRGEVSLLVGDLPRGFVSTAAGLAFVPVTALFGAPRRAAVRDRATDLWDASVTSMADLKVGDAVVHRLHGVGLYQGLQRLSLHGGEVPHDYVKLEYKGGDLMFLPVHALDQLSRYTAATDGAQPGLDKLGGATWARRKGKVRDHLLSMAQDLLRLYARRELAERASMAHLGPRYRAFEARFPHQETPDQALAIQQVLDDLARPTPMDRLICGDVGFGKTEVAMRAAMQVVESGRQVLVLCPTTVLAHQHYRSFVARFAVDPGVRVAMLSRFTPRDEEARVRAGLADGSVHVVVGTTALLGHDVKFSDLGLAVIDEEHRFGVKQKDRLKRMRTEIDMLALSATPIPRSLQLALSGARDMSLIATPPPMRLSVRTQVARYHEGRVREALVDELSRGGQVYFVHNRVETIDAIAEELRGWVPEARFAVAHGQQSPEALERVLVDFVEKRVDVLVCSTIVESGVDLPNVNTMLVNRADQLGLAQLYQLRGRVGRGDRRATCILLTPEEVAGDARKRLQVLLDNQSLGAGFRVATADLELRGGGNLLGASQSGHIDAIGYDAWVELLEEAVHAARGDVEMERIDPEVEVPVPAFLPEIMVKDPQERLDWYRRLSHARSATEVDRLLDELESERGELLEPARNLGDLVAARIACKELGIGRCHWQKVRVVLDAHPKSPLHARRWLDAAIERHPKRFERRGETGFAVRFTPQEAEKPLRYLRWVFSQLRQRDGVPGAGPRGVSR